MGRKTHDRGRRLFEKGNSAFRGDRFLENSVHIAFPEGEKGREGGGFLRPAGEGVLTDRHRIGGRSFIIAPIGAVVKGFQEKSETIFRHLTFYFSTGGILPVENYDLL